MSQSPEEAPSRAGDLRSGLTRREYETLQMLLEPNVKTYKDAALRLGITENAIKQRIGRVDLRYHSAKSFCNRFEEWRRKRRDHKRGKH